LAAASFSGARAQEKEAAAKGGGAAN